MTGHLSSDNYVEEKKKYKVRIRMVIDGVSEKFEDIALDCKGFQPDDI